MWTVWSFVWFFDAMAKAKDSRTRRHCRLDPRVHPVKLVCADRGVGNLEFAWWRKTKAGILSTCKLLIRR